MHFPRLRQRNAWHYLLVAFVCLLGLGTTNNLWLGNSFAINAIWEIGPCHAFKSHMKTLGKLRFSKLQQLSYSVFHGAGQLNMIYSIPNSVGWLHCLWSGVGLDRQTGTLLSRNMLNHITGSNSCRRIRTKQVGKPQGIGNKQWLLVGTKARSQWGLVGNVPITCRKYIHHNGICL